jgi:hypothetical protein
MTTFKLLNGGTFLARVGDGFGFRVQRLRGCQSPRFALPIRLILLRSRSAFVSFDVNFNLNAFLQLHFVALLVGQCVLDADFMTW